jgi:N-acetylmuramoyl-L-alanine amidase
MHYTACPIDEALQIFSSSFTEVSTHYLLSAQGKIYDIVPETKRAWHAGPSNWRGFEDVNSFSIGIENANWGYRYGWIPQEPKHDRFRNIWSSFIHSQRRIGEYLDRKNIFSPKKKWDSYPEAQVNSLTLLAQDILNRLGIEAENVVGHSDVAPQRKKDPGPLFPWQRLALNGVGVWHDPLVDRIHSDKPKTVSVSWIQTALDAWGYSVPKNGHLDPQTANVIQAFQMHFRQSKCNGQPDEETCEILDRLLCAQRNRHDQIRA